MASSQQGASAAAGKRKARDLEAGLPVLEQHPGAAGSHDGAIILGCRVTAESALKSDLLAGIAGTDGLAVLPEAISVAEVQLWQAACLIDDQLPTDELATVLKVADVLGGEGLKRWVSEMADRVLQTDWRDSAVGDAMLAHLLALPPHLLHQTLASCIPISAQRMSMDPDSYGMNEAIAAMGDIYATLPPALHTPLIGSAISGGTLFAPQGADTNFFMHLASAAALTPDLERLDLSEMQQLTAAQAAMLGRAICAHPSLRALICESRAQLSIAALRALTACTHRHCVVSLTKVEVTVEWCPETVHALVDLLKKLVSAEDITLCASEMRPMHDGVLAAGDVVSLRPAATSAAYPACMERLKQLKLEERMGEGGGDRHGHLQQVLSLMHAPLLSSLQIDTTAGRMSKRAFLTRVARFTALRQLYIKADCSLLAPPETPLRAEVALPALEELTVVWWCAWRSMMLAQTLVAAANASLLRLCVDQHEDKCDRACGVGDAHATCMSVCEVWSEIGKCSQLQHLGISLLQTSFGRAGERRQSEAVATALGRLTHLTSLGLTPHKIQCRCERGRRCTLHADRLVPALRGLRGLQELRLNQSGWSFGPSELDLNIDEPGAVMDSCAQLTDLRVLYLQIKGLQMEGVAGVVPRLPALTKLVLLSALSEEEQEVEALQARFPALKISFRLL